MEITSSETRATATTSARRITGGRSFLLSGSGVPTGLLAGFWGSPRTTTSPPRHCGWRRDEAVLRTGAPALINPLSVAKVPSRKRERPGGLTAQLFRRVGGNRTTLVAFVVQSIT